MHLKKKKTGTAIRAAVRCRMEGRVGYSMSLTEEYGRASVRMMQTNLGDDGEDFETQNPASRACFSLMLCMETNLLEHSISTPHDSTSRGVFQVLALLSVGINIRQLCDV